MAWLKSLLDGIKKFFSPKALPPTSKSPAPHVVRDPTVPRWFEIGQSQVGVTEYPGEQHNPMILKYHRAVLGGLKRDEDSWCSSFVSWCLEEAGLPSTDSATARSYLQYGVQTSPKVGAIVVFWRERRSSWKGHVGFFVYQDEKNVYCLGGNQGNSVNIAAYPKSRVLDYRWPKE